MFCLIWISHCISHLRIHIQCIIAMRNQFSQNMIVYISMTDLFIMYHYRCWRCYQLLQLDVVFTSKFDPIITKVWTSNHDNCIYNLVKKGTEWFKRSCIKTCYLISYISAAFTYRLGRLKPRASEIRVLPAKVHSYFDTVIGHSDICCHNTLYSLSNHSVITPRQRSCEGI
jgi:hypothetical protein